MRDQRHTATRLLTVASLSLLAACGGESKDDSSGGGASSNGGSNSGAGGASAGAAGSGGSSAGSGGSVGGSAGSGGTSSGGASAYCPTSPPAQGSACMVPATAGGDFVQAHCSWGDDPRPECRTLARCSQATWEVTAPDATICSEPPLPSACPSTPASAGTTCDDEALRCIYDDGTSCWCSACSGGSEYPICQPIDPPEWACSEPLDGCPITPPQAGAPCSVEGQNCGTSCERPIRCVEGAWVYEPEMCPICASPATPIATPQGERSIAELRPGDLVYSVEGAATVVVPVLRAGSTPVRNHRVVRVLLESGRMLEISPGHPLLDGRSFGDLTSGALLDDLNRVVSSELVPYGYERTYDILPASSSGAYFAAGALIGSTLGR